LLIFWLIYEIGSVKEEDNKNEYYGTNSSNKDKQFSSKTKFFI
jgi:hypothetical protein